MSIRRAAAGEIELATLYEILRLRAQVFVVEQTCAYLDPDGNDLLPNTVHWWWDSSDGVIDAYLRVIDDVRGRRIGRVVTAEPARHKGRAAALIDKAIAEIDGPCVLDAQSYLVGWYERIGFEATGPEYIEDGIPHTPMRLVR
jgi:ElaA protein